MRPICHNCDRDPGEGMGLCTTCAGNLSKELRTVPGLVEDMTITRARLDRMTRNRLGGKSADTPPYVKLIGGKARIRPTERPLDALVNEITTWARDVAWHTHSIDQFQAAIESAGLRQLASNHRLRKVDHAALLTDDARGVDLAALWLADYAPELRAHPAIGELFDAVTDVIGNAREVVDRLPELSYKGTCEYSWLDERHNVRVCKADLYVERGDDWARCPSCNALYDVRQLDRSILAKMHDMNYTADELKTLLDEMQIKLPKNTIRTWAYRKELRPRGWKRRSTGQITDHFLHRNDPPVYRLGDVLALAEKRGRPSQT